MTYEYTLAGPVPVVHPPACQDADNNPNDSRTIDGDERHDNADQDLQALLQFCQRIITAALLSMLAATNYQEISSVYFSDIFENVWKITVIF